MPDEPAAPIVVPHRELEHSTLRGVVESFVLREGTDYGLRETSLDDKVSEVLAQLRKGEAHIVFDPESESISIVLSRDV